jgi:hypothetical protein
MTISVSCFHTIFGDLVKTFDNFDDALNWVRVCLSNDVNCTIEIE